MRWLLLFAIVVVVAIEIGNGQDRDEIRRRITQARRQQALATGQESGSERTEDGDREQAAGRRGNGRRGRNRRRKNRKRQKLVTDLNAQGQSDFLTATELLYQFYETVNAKRGHPVAFDAEVVSEELVQYDDGTELTKNREIVGDLFESDIVLTVPQITAIIAAYEQDNGRRKRKVTSTATDQWPSTTISYRFGDTDSSWQTRIRASLRHWESETCIRFSENGPGTDYMNFIKGGGCYSSVGKTGGSQAVSIGTGCDTLGIIAHEVGHAMGFWHEQSRPDRDSHVNVYEQNMISGTTGNMVKRATNQINYYGAPYDYGSVMHYGPKAFATSTSLYTISPKDDKYLNTIGQRAATSFIDVLQINSMYCSGICRTNLGCLNGGYADPNNCNQCKCPSGLGGPRCGAVATSNCGREILATSEWQTLTGTTGVCYWRISSNGGRVRFEVTEAAYSCSDTCRSYVEVKHNSDFTQTGFRLCCGPKGGQVLSQRQDIIVISTQGGQFTLRYRDEGGGSVTPGPTPAPNTPSPPTIRTRPTPWWSVRPTWTTQRPTWTRRTRPTPWWRTRPTPWWRTRPTWTTRPPPTGQCFGFIRGPCFMINRGLRRRFSQADEDGTIRLNRSLTRLVHFDNRSNRQGRWRGGRNRWQRQIGGRRPGGGICSRRIAYECGDENNNRLRVRLADGQ